MGGCRTHVMDAAHGGTANVYEFTTFAYKAEEKSTKHISGPLRTVFKKSWARVRVVTETPEHTPALIDSIKNNVH